MKNKNVLKKVIPHGTAILLFLIISAIYFYPQLKGYQLRQYDHDHFVGMSKEIMDFREKENKEPLWTNSMFSGMPTYQISLHHKANLIRKIENTIILKWLGNPIGIFFLCILGFYILLICMKINPWLSIIGAIVFGFSTIHILYLSSGHVTRVHSIALIPPIIGGVLMAYRKNLLTGAVITSLFVAFQVSANHIQQTYYMLFLIIAIIIVEFVNHFKSKTLPKFFKISIILIFASIIGILPSASNLLITKEYGRYSTRSKSELTILDNKEQTSGLDRSYIKEYNFSKGEVWSTVIPNVKGGKQAYLGSEMNLINEIVEPNYREPVSKSMKYWGEQSATGGAFYFGAAIFLLFILGLIFVKDNIKWAFLGASILAIVLSWKYSAILDFFISYFPLFNKFRDTKIILILVQVAFPFVGMLFLNELIKKELDFKKVFKSIAIVLAVMFAFYVAPKLWFSFLSSQEIEQFDTQIASLKNNPQVAAQYEVFKESIQDVRVAIFRKDLIRSIFFILVTGILILGFLKNKIKQNQLIIGLLLIVLIDLWAINKRYLNNEKKGRNYISWVKKQEKTNPFKASNADKAILNNELSQNKDLVEKIKIETEKHLSGNRISKKFRPIEQEKIAFRELNAATNYRVLTFANPFNNSELSYFHKSIGGYHGAKLKKYQELIEFRISKELQGFGAMIQKQPNQKDLNNYLENKIPTLNMLNTKYIIINPNNNPIKNEFANDNAWFVKNAEIVENADEEILSLDTIDPKNTAVLIKKLLPKSELNFMYDSLAKIDLVSYKPNHLTYEYNASTPQLAVFSEIFYPAGWNAYINGKKASYFRANYVLRSMLLPEGKHLVEFKFEPESYSIGNKISLASSILLITGCLLVTVVNIKKLKT